MFLWSSKAQNKQPSETNNNIFVYQNRKLKQKLEGKKIENFD